MTVSLNIIVWKPSGAVEVVLAGTPQRTALGGFLRLRTSRFRGLLSRLRRSGPALPRETGAIVDADVRPGNEHDTADLTEKVLEVEARMNEVMEDDKNAERVELVAADKGYFKLDEISVLQGVGIDTAISDSQRKRRTDRLSEEDRAALEAAQAVVTSEAGRGWMRKRSELVERGFQHVLDCGGARRTTLRGRENIRKRYLLQAACANLSLLMRHLAGVGTPRQALAGSHGPVSALVRAIGGIFSLRWPRWTRPVTQNHPLALAAA